MIGDLVGAFLSEVVLELAIKGPGYLIARGIKSNVDPDGGWAVLAGLTFWAVIGTAGFLVYRAVVS